MFEADDARVVQQEITLMFFNLGNLVIRLLSLLHGRKKCLNSLCENVLSTSFHSNCLVLYVASPFRHGNKISSAHQNNSQLVELVKVISEFGYNIDVCDYNDKTLSLTKQYDLVIDIHPQQNNIYMENLSENVIRIGYFTGSNPAFSNEAEQKRLDDLYQRRGSRLAPRRQVLPFEKEVLESLDAIFFIGNEYNLRSYKEFQFKKICMIQNSGYDFDFVSMSSSRSSKNFVFLASSGQVHKGLDLLLEVFARNSNLNLYVLSLFNNEKDFCDLYRRELFESANIFPIGFLDITSDKFREIVQKCAFVVLPSCSEANAGSVFTGMSAGLIPIVSRECGFEESEVHYLPDCSVTGIEKSLVEFSEKSSKWIEVESRKAVETVKTKYTLNHYRILVKDALNSVLISRSTKTIPTV